jgi:hypothetical protein
MLNGIFIRYCVRKIYAFSLDFANYSTLCRNYNKGFLPTPVGLVKIIFADARYSFCRGYYFHD